MERLRDVLPARIHGWQAATEDRLFNERSIFDYINGGAEVYRAYHMRRCLSRRYRIPDGPDIVLDIFDMGRPEDAFGVFTHDTDGKILDIGQDARYRPGWLSFWKHRFFFSLYMDSETAAAEKAVIALAQQIASLVREDGQRPDILSTLPPKGLKAKHIRYLYHPIIFNYHFYLADDNILNLSPQTAAALAPYRRGNEAATLLLVRYPDRQQAEKSMESFLKHYLPEAAGTGLARLEDGKWAACSRKGDLLVVVLESDSTALAESLLKDITP
ncbi:MAG: hypothetical protein JRJ85_02420 [Deltaproteobacteria bacterium]|nr:hypothetical protein [Deltaproteobacteria bacterium]